MKTPSKTFLVAVAGNIKQIPAQSKHEAKYIGYKNAQCRSITVGFPAPTWGEVAVIREIKQNDRH